jgi:ADP-L-glycero-D-manno-heptose 6-epimerase
MILVTGGAGFIGSNLVKNLNHAGHDVAVVDYLGSEDKWRNLQDCKVWKFYTPEEIMHGLTAMPTCVIHLGAATLTTNADLMIKTNFTLSWHIWDWCRQHGRPIIYASSADTYGLGLQGFDDDHDRLSSLQPSNLLGWSKHQFDQKVVNWIKQGKDTPPQWVGLKLFDVYGPRESHKGSHASVPYNFFQKLVNQQPIELFNSTDPSIAHGHQTRDLIYVDDVVDVIIWCMDHICSGIYNVGTGHASSFEEIAQCSIDTTNSNSKPVFVPMPDQLGKIYPNHMQANISKLRSIGYNKMMTPIHEGVEKYYQWLTANSIWTIGKTLVWTHKTQP